MSGGPSMPPDVRIVLDIRPLQEPERAPLTAAYLDALLGAFDADPIPGESFVALMRVDLPDPLERFPALPIAARRPLPPGRLMAAATPAGDPLLLAGAAFVAGLGAGRGGSVRPVFHAVGSSLPMAGGLPLVATLLDVAPWRLPEAFQRTTGARFGVRLRRRILRRAAAVIVGTTAVARVARRLVRVPEDRVHVVGFAARPAMMDPQIDAAVDRSLAAHHGLGERYYAYSGRFDARHDLETLLAALRSLGAAARPSDLEPDVDWPPRIAIVGASPDDRAALARRAAGSGVGELLAYLPGVSDAAAARIIAGARAVLVPALSDAVGLAVLDGLAVGVPIIATAVDGLPELVGDAGLLVPAREPERMATAISAVHRDDQLHRVLAERAMESPVRARRWADVARETRAVYAAVGSTTGLPT